MNKTSDVRRVVSTTSTFTVESYTPSNDDSTVLAHLSGQFSVADHPSDNGNNYPPELWIDLINSDKVREMIETKTFFGELSHPPREAEQISEVQMNNVSHNITKLEYDESTGLVTGEIDILDTPSGRIANTFIEYGSQLGISSRFLQFDESNTLTPYNSFFVTFDLVAMPGVRGSRLTKKVKAKSEALVHKVTDYVSEALRAKDTDSLLAYKRAVPVLESLVATPSDYETINRTIDDAIAISGNNLELIEDPEDVKSIDEVVNDEEHVHDEVVETTTESLDNDVVEDDDEEDILDDTTESTEVSDVAGPTDGMLVMPDGEINRKLESEQPNEDEDTESTSEVGEVIVDKEVPNSTDQQIIIEDDSTEVGVLDDNAQVTPYTEVTDVKVDDEKSDKDMNAVVESLTNICNELKSSIQELSTENRDLRNRLEALSDKVRSTTSVNETLKSRIKSMTESHASQLRTRDERIKKLSSELRESKSNTVKSTTESVAAKKVTEQLKSSLARALSANESLTAQVSELQSELSKATQESVLSNRDSRIARVKKALESNSAINVTSTDEIIAREHDIYSQYDDDAAIASNKELTAILTRKNQLSRTK